MLKFKAAVAAVLLALVLPVGVSAQGCGTSNPNCIVPTAPVGTSNNQAASTAFVQGAVSVNNPGGSNGQIQYKNGSAFGGFTASGDATVNTATGAVTIQPNAVTTGKILDANVTNAKVAPGAANTVKGSINGTTTSDLAIASCSAIYQFTQWVSGSGWQCGLIPVLPSRAVAATLNLSAFTSVITLGYAQPGDGGGALFANVTTTPLRDTAVGSLTITNNGTSTCTNNTYLGKQPSGGSGTNLTVNVTVAGNVVSAVTVEDTGGNGYAVGNVVSLTVTGCSQTVTFTVATVTTATCSFSDSAGNHLQIKADAGNFLNVRQCGAKVDYAGTDGTATDDRVSIQNAWNLCSDIHSPTVDGGGSAGCRVIHPAGNSLICGSVPLNLPQGVAPEGNNIWASTLKMCSAWTSGTAFLNICDPDTHLSCFGSYLRNLTLYSPFAQSSSANSSMVYSNSIQQVDVFDRVAIYSGQRECLRLEVGYGGAALLGMQNVECTPGTTSVNAGILINYGTTLVTMRNVHVETSGPATTSGIRITGGFVHLSGFHTEGISTGVEVNIPTSTAFGFAKLEDMTGGASCTNLVLRQGGSAASTVYVSNLTQNGCTNNVNNAGALTTTFVGIWTLF